MDKIIVPSVGNYVMKQLLIMIERVLTCSTLTIGICILYIYFYQGLVVYCWLIRPQLFLSSSNSLLSTQLCTIPTIVYEEEKAHKLVHHLPLTATKSR